MSWAVLYHDCDIVLPTQADNIEQGGHKECKNRHNDRQGSEKNH